MVAPRATLGGCDVVLLTSSLLLVGSLACSSPPPPRLTPDSAAPTPAESGPVAALPPGAEAHPIPEPAVPERPRTKILESGDGDPHRDGRDLFAAAQRARAEKIGDTTAPVAIITNENLADYADVPLTTAQPSHTSSAGPGEAGTQESDLEEYWRARVRSLRELWGTAVERQDELKEEIAGLRQQFYAADDPYYRDSQIKPKWDRALSGLAKAEWDETSSQEALARALEEGRRAGALPGWLREGIELEPKPRETTTKNPAEPGEPQTINDFVDP